MGFESLQIGQVLATLDKGPITTAHIMRWSAAVENWHRIHYDQAFATGHETLPNVQINGSWKQHVLVQLVKDGLGPGGWLWRLKFRYRRMDVAGDALRARARVIAKQEADGLGFVTVAVELLNQRDEVSTDGQAIGVMALSGGRPVPYPFVASPAMSAVRFVQDD